MQVSFIIPSFNKGPFIGQCLDSIAAQRLAPGSFEVRVYDNESTDATVEILRAHPLRPHWVSERDGGQAAAVNRGLREARGEFIAWINADDFYRPGALTPLLAAFSNPARPRVVYGRADIVDETGRNLGPYPVEPWNLARLADFCFLCQPAVFFRRDVVTEAGLLDESLHLALDYEFWLRLGQKAPFQFLDQTLAATRDYAETKTRLRRVDVQRECLLVSHWHTGRWSQKWLRGLAKHEVRAALGVPEEAEHWPAHLAEVCWWRLWQLRLHSREARGWTEADHAQAFLRAAQGKD